MMDEEDGVVNRRLKTKFLTKKKNEHRVIIQSDSVDDLCS